MTAKPRMTRTLAAWCVLGSLVVAAGCGPSSDPAQLVASAKEYIAKKDPAAAAIQLKNALQREPANGEARFLLGRILLDQGDSQSAEKELRRALEYRYSPAAVTPVLAKAMLRLGQAKQLTAEFAATTLDDPAAQAELKNELGQAYLLLGQVKDASAAYAAALKAQPDNLRARVGEARILAIERDLSAANKAVDAVLAQAPANPDALALKVDLLLSEGEREPARQALAKLIQARPEDSAQARFTLVSLLIDAGTFDQAQTELEAMRKATPGDIRTRYLDALLAMRKGEPAKAKEAIFEVIKIAPDHLPSRVLAGLIDLRLGQYVTAEDHLRRVVAAAPQGSYARLLLAIAYLRQGQPGRAEEVIAPALAREPKNSRLLQVAGEVALAKGDLAGASSAYERAASIDKDNPRVRTQLARARFASGDLGQGFKDLESASALDPTQYQADIALIMANLGRREYDKALAAAATLEKKQPDNPLTYDLKGRVYLLKGDRKSARSSFEKALQLQPDHLPATRNLAAMDLADKQPDAARKRYEVILAKAAGNEGALIGLAEILAATRAPAKEISAPLERAVASNPTSPNARLALIRFLSQTRDTKGALAAAESARAALPNDPRIVNALGLSQLAAGETKQAIATYTALVGAQPESPAALLALARAQLIAKDHDGAIASIRKAMDLRSDLVQLQADIAAVQLAAGNPAAAFKEARSLQAARPKEAMGYMLEGELHASQKKFPEAVSAYAEAFKRQPSAQIVMRLHALNESAGKPGDGAKVVAAWLRDQPKDLAVRLYLAEDALRKKDYPAAAKGYREVLAIQADNVIALNNLAWALGELKDPAAFGYAEKAYNLASGNPGVADTYGWMLVERGETKRGVEILAEAALAAPNAAEIRLHYAKALLKAGDKAAARKELEVISTATVESTYKAEAVALLKQL